MPRFSILRHESPEDLHWDFLLEMGPALRTWALPEEPDPGTEMIGRRLPDHRLAYLHYEGPISGDRGSVTRWDWGTYDALQESEGMLVLDVRGQRLVSRIVLERLPGDPERWRISYPKPN